jgi:HSP20 family protein
MTQIGIGELKHSSQKKAATKAKSAVKFNAREHKQEEDQSKKEGQLAVDIIQSDTEMIIVCPIAGVEKADIKVAIQDDVLTIRGERIKPNVLENKKALVRELFWGTFSRSIVLPDHIDRKNIAAKVHEHMLIVTIPKTEDFKTRIIHIND